MLIRGFKLDNKATIIAVCAALLLLTLVFACSKGCSTKPSTGTKSAFKTTPKTQTAVTKDKHKYDDFRPMSSSAGSGHSGSYYEETSEDDKTPPALISEEEKKRMKKFDAEEEEAMKKSAAEWLQNKLADSSLSAKTREQWLLKANQSYNDGKNARKRKDYKSAIKHFNDILKDEKATPVTKYFALYNLMGCAQEMKDLELFFIAARMRAKLVATEDLTVVGVEQKNTDQLVWCDKVEAALKAKDNPAKFDEAVMLKMNEHNGELERETAEASVKRDIEFYTKLFKDFYE